MADEDEHGDFREFTSFLKAHPKGMHGHTSHDWHSRRGKGLYNWHQGRDAGGYGQELTCVETFGSSNAGFREGWGHMNNRASEVINNIDLLPHKNVQCFNRASKGSNNIDLLSHKNVQGSPQMLRGHQYAYAVHEYRRNQQNSQMFNDRLQGHGCGSNKTRGRGTRGWAGNQICGRGYYYQGVSNYKDAGSSHFHGEGRKLQPDSGGKQMKNEAFSYNRGKRGGRGHRFYGSYKRVGARSGNSKIFQSVNNKVIVSDFSPVDVGATQHFGCKIDGNVCSIQLPRATEDDDFICKESDIHGPCPIQSPASNCCSPLPVFQRSGSQEEKVSVETESMNKSGDQRHLERALISCVGGTKKRRRSSAVRDFPVRSGRVRIFSMKKIITKFKDSRGLLPSRDLVLADSAPAREVDAQFDRRVAKETVSISKVINVPADCDPETTIEDCNKVHFEMTELVKSDLETVSGSASKIVLDEGNPSAESTEASLEQITEESTSLTSPKGDVRKERVAELSEVTNAESYSKTCFQEGADSQVGFEIVQADPLELNEQLLDRKDIQISENSSQISSQPPSFLTHVKNPEAPDVATGVLLQMYAQENEQILLKERKKNRRTNMHAVDGLPKLKSRLNKVDKLPVALKDELHKQGHMSKKLKVQDSLECTKETGALIPYQGTVEGMMRNKDSRTRLFHKGSSRAKLFQTSKSLDTNDAVKSSTLEASEGVSDRALVKRTLHEFEFIRKTLVKSQNAVKRADLDAGSLLRERGKWRNCDEKIVGEVPGVEVGDQFSFRMEMLIIGLHRQVQSGIDYIPGSKRCNGSPLATSIVASGGYEDDKDDGNTLIYSGQGGNSNKGNKKQESNQELVRGNLALSNSMKEKTPVRVIRGTTDLASPSSKVYTYDGLYDVVNYAFECGAAGFWVYQFTLTRRPGQPQVGLSFLSILKKKGLSRPNLLMNDISRGQERLPVCVVNEVDDEPAPLYFSYIPSIKYPVWYSPLLPQGCQCIGICDEETCSCAIKNGGELPYNEKGYLLRDKMVVYECGPSCGCSSSCENRVTQKGLRYRLEIFKTKDRGWGVRSLDSIQSGGFICEYTGELLSDAEAEQRIGNDEYLFDLGNKCNPSGDESDILDTDSSLAIVPVAEDVEYTIDAKDLGNVARFINHSCSPNLYAQNVLFDSDDLRFPHVMLIAMERIPPMRELTYDYHYSLNQVRDARGNIKIKACYCGAQDCQGRLY